MKQRLPKSGGIYPPAAVIAVFVYGWALVRFAWRLPSWLHYLTLGDLFGIFSYAMLTALLESLLILGLLLLLAAVLPAGWLREVFALRASAFSLIVLAAILGFLIQFERLGPDFIEYIEVWSLGALLLAILFAWLVGWMRPLGAAVTWLADRLVVFLYLLLPLSLLGGMVVLLRNLF